MVAVADEYVIAKYTPYIFLYSFNMVSLYCDGVHNPRAINFKVNKHAYGTL
jgi:hypothetical protein